MSDPRWSRIVLKLSGEAFAGEAGYGIDGAIVRQLATEGEASCQALEGDRPKSSVSHHFRVLREAGLIRTRNEGATRMNALRREDIEGRFPGLLACVLSRQNG